MSSKDVWTPAASLLLEPNALIAVREEKRSLALTAGPGAGKTEMLAQKADYLLRTGECRFPQRILAIAFKVDASTNLRQRVQLRCGSDLASRFDSQTFHGFAKRLIDRFRPVLTGIDALDSNYTIGEVRVQRTQITYQDLIPLAREILRNSEMARAALAQTYNYVFLDEFQDCTNEQYQLIRESFLNTDAILTAVGDTKQRIMGWAGALEGIFETFASDFNARPLNLYQNFRSKPRLRRMQNAMVRVMDPPAAVDDAELAGEAGEIRACKFDSDDREAAWVAETIKNWITDGLVPSEIAVLVAKLPECYAVKLMEELASRGVPFRDEKQLQDLGTEPIARAIVDLLKCVFLDRAPVSYARLMELYEGRWHDSTNPAPHRRFREFIDQQRSIVRSSNYSGPTDESLRSVSTAFQNLIGLAALASLSPNYSQGVHLEALVTQTHARIQELLAKGLSITDALDRFSEDGAVRIMTIHKSKGLEFHTVIALAIENETFFGKDDVERSAFFVQVSRAKERLLLTFVKNRPRPLNYERYWAEDRSPQKEFIGYALAAKNS
jgi:superfamily I DNA/RNA helicase